eukprot:298972-Pyramimonas_sp.AAC.1
MPEEGNSLPEEGSSPPGEAFRCRGREEAFRFWGRKKDSLRGGVSVWASTLERYFPRKIAARWSVIVAHTARDVRVSQ